MRAVNWRMLVPEPFESDQPTGPLRGVRVLDLTHVLNGPFCTMLLAHMGAEVIKVEHGAGDRFRHAWMPEDADHDGYEFSVVNANKKAITLNLKSDRGKELFEELLRRSDVVVENFSADVMERLGLGYDRLKAVNPKVIYACARGYGETGPRRDVRANAATILACTGWTAAAWGHSGAPGTKTLGIGDEAAGVSMAVGILAALYARASTGVGQMIEVSMQESMLAFMVSTLHTHFEGRPVGEPVAQCADGYVAFHLPDMSDTLWHSFASAMDHVEALDDARFASVAARRANFHALEDLVLGHWVREKTREEMWKVIEQTRVSCAPVLTVDEVLVDAHLAARNAFVQVPQENRSPLTMLRPWIHFSETPTELRWAGPRVGEHNHEVFGEYLGLSAAEVAKLEGQGVI